MGKKKTDTISVVKKIGVILFVGGFLFAQPIITAIGAVGWGGMTLYELITKRKGE